MCGDGINRNSNGRENKDKVWLFVKIDNIYKLARLMRKTVDLNHYVKNPRGAITRGAAGLEEQPECHWAPVGQGGALLEPTGKKEPERGAQSSGGTTCARQENPRSSEEAG